MGEWEKSFIPTERKKKPKKIELWEKGKGVLDATNGKEGEKTKQKTLEEFPIEGKEIQEKS